ncbi:MAG: DUF5777 family beta-barrel protein [Bacteroidota bacterium]
MNKIEHQLQFILFGILLLIIPITGNAISPPSDSLKNTFSDEPLTYQTFKDRRVINAHSVETLPARKLDVRIGHRFGDMFGDAGGWPTFYGLENATDVMIGAEYGITDRLLVGAYRTKGAGALRQLLNGVVKWKIGQQYQERPRSVTLTALTVWSVSTMQKSDNLEAINAFQKFSHRLAYTTQLIIGRKFSETFSLQLAPGYTHRNLVDFEENNGLFSLGVAGRWQWTRVVGLLFDITLPFNGPQSPFTEQGANYHLPLGLGVEFDTGGHIFQVNLTNARGLMESDYIPNTTSNWLKGQFRLGFTISRLFNVR